MTRIVQNTENHQIATLVESFIVCNGVERFDIEYIENSSGEVFEYSYESKEDLDKEWSMFVEYANPEKYPPKKERKSRKNWNINCLTQSVEPIKVEKETYENIVETKFTDEKQEVHVSEVKLENRVINDKTFTFILIPIKGSENMMQLAFKIDNDFSVKLDVDKEVQQNKLSTFANPEEDRNLASHTENIIESKSQSFKKDSVDLSKQVKTIRRFINNKLFGFLLIPISGSNKMMQLAIDWSR